MNIKIYEDRKLLNESDEFGSQYENLATTIIFEFPEFVEKDGVQFATKDLNKTIVFNIEGDNELPIIEDKFSFPYDITKLGEVVWNICLKEKSDTEDMTDKLIWYSETMTTNFNNTNEGHNEITIQKLDAFNSVITTLNGKIAEVEALKVDIGGYKEALDKKVDKKEGYGLSQNDFTDELKKKLEELSLDEHFVESGIYDEKTHEIVLTLTNGNTVRIPVNDLLDDFYIKEEIDNFIAELKEENIKQQEEIDDLYNEFEKGEASGESININDSSDLKMKIIPFGEPTQVVIPEELGNTVEGSTVVISDGDVNKEVKSTIKGNTYQDTREGYNLLDLSSRNNETRNGVDIVIDTNRGSMILNGACTEATLLNIPLKEIIPAGTVISFGAFNNKVASTNKTQLRTNNTELNIQEKPIGLDTLNAKVDNYTLQNDLTNMQVRLEVNEVYDNFEIFPQLEISSTLHKQEPYGSKPSIEFPSEIEVIDTVNIFNKNDFTKVNLTTSTGTTLVQSPSNNILVLPCEPNTTYTIKKDVVALYFQAMFTSEEVVAGVSYHNWVANNTGTKIQATSSSNSKYLVVWYYNKNDTVTEQEILDSITIYKGTDDKPYLPYGHIGLVQRGKNEYSNLKNYDLVKFKADCEIIDDNTLKVFTTESTTWGHIQFKKKGFKKGQKYKFSCEFTNSNGSITTSYILLRGVNTGTDAFIGRINNGQEIEFTLDDTELYVRFNCTQATAMENTTVYSKIQISEIGGEYEPYHEPKTIPIDLAENKLAKVGEIADLLNIGVNGSVSITKNNKFYEFKGDEYYTKSTLSTDEYFRGYLQASDTDYKSEQTFGYCNMLKFGKYSDTTEGEILYTGIQKHIQIKASRLSENSVAGLRAFFKELYDNGTPMKMLGQLAEPRTINLPSIEPIELFEGTNVLELVTNLDTTMAVTYNYVTPSPSIDRPSEILTVQGSYDTEKVNENLFDKENTDLILNDTFINYSAKKLASVSGAKTLFVRCKPQETYTISKIISARFILGTAEEKPSNGVMINNLRAENPNSSITITTGEKDKYIVVFYYLDGTDTLSEEEIRNSIQIQVGDVTPYTPHKSTTLPLTIANELLGEIVTLTKEQADALNLDGAGKYVRTDYGRYVFTGDENFITMAATKNTIFQFQGLKDLIKKPEDTSKVIRTYSNYFNGNSSADYVWGNDIQAIGVNKTGFLNIGLGLNSEIKTLAELQALLKEWYDNGEPLEIIYPLATSTYTKITDENQLEQLTEYDKQKSFYPVTNINTELLDDVNKAPLKVKVEYYKSNKTLNSQQSEKISDLLARVENLENNAINS